MFIKIEIIFYFDEFLFNILFYFNEIIKIK